MYRLLCPTSFELKVWCQIDPSQHVSIHTQPRHLHGRLALTPWTETSKTFITQIKDRVLHYISSLSMNNIKLTIILLKIKAPISDNLSWWPHVYNIAKVVFQRLNFFLKARIYMGHYYLSLQSSCAITLENKSHTTALTISKNGCWSEKIHPPIC